MTFAEELVYHFGISIFVDSLKRVGVTLLEREEMLGSFQSAFPQRGGGTRSGDNAERPPLVVKRFPVHRYRLADSARPDDQLETVDNRCG
ncbi:MAG: hypothetical protein WD847_18685 [Pirellulales bacterium]